jgi:hypothetical protein
MFCYICRFEAKHQYFKRLTSRTKNFKNILKTLSTRHQLGQAFWMLMPEEDFECQIGQFYT